MIETMDPPTMLRPQNAVARKRMWFICPDCGIVVRTRPLSDSEMESWDIRRFCHVEGHGHTFASGEWIKVSTEGYEIEHTILAEED